MLRYKYFSETIRHSLQTRRRGTRYHRGRNLNSVPLVYSEMKSSIMTSKVSTGSDESLILWEMDGWSSTYQHDTSAQKNKACTYETCTWKVIFRECWRWEQHTVEDVGKAMKLHSCLIMITGMPCDRGRARLIFISSSHRKNNFISSESQVRKHRGRKRTQTGKEIKNKPQSMEAQDKSNKPELQLPTGASWFLYFRFVLKYSRVGQENRLRHIWMKYVKICNRN